eukprot:gene54-4024_t
MQALLHNGELREGNGPDSKERTPYTAFGLCNRDTLQDVELGIYSIQNIELPID